MGAQSADNVLKAIEERRQISLDRFIYALGIRQIGQATARLLAKQYGSLAEWRLAMARAVEERAGLPDEMKDPELVGETFAELCNIDQIGFSVADNLVSFFVEQHNHSVLKDLAETLVVQKFVVTDTPNLRLRVRRSCLQVRLRP